MKNLIALIITFALIQTTVAQSSGIISYTSVRKLEIKMDDMPAGIDLSGMLPTERTTYKDLVFKGSESIYIDSKKEESEETEFTSDDGNFKMIMIESDIESILYSNYKTKESVSQEDFLGKGFVIISELPKLKWKITSEKVKYLGYECIKATTVNEENEEIVAWFAPAIKSQAGPEEFGQLPGAILMLSENDGKLEIKATKIDLKEIDKIDIPDDGKKVTSEEYDLLIEEKMKEMAKEHGGEGVSISIRG